MGDAATVQALTKINVPTRVDEDGNTQFISVPDHVEIYEMPGPLMHIKFSDVLGHAPEDTIWLYGTEGTLELMVPIEKFMVVENLILI